MTRTVSGPLRRTLTQIGVTSDLLSVGGTDFATTDDEIMSVSISHGGSDPSPALEPSTCELSITGARWIQTGNPLTVTLTASAAALLAAYTGTVTAAQIQARFAGRIGRQVNHDEPGRASSSLAAASWSAQLNHLDASYRLQAGWTVAQALGYLCTSPDLHALTIGAAGQFDVLAETILDAGRDQISALTADIGVLVRERRDGSLQAVSLTHRYAEASARIATGWPLVRSQVLAPTSWDQPNEDFRPRLRAYWIAADGTTVVRLHGGTDASAVQEHDWRHIKDQTGALDLHWAGINRRLDPREFTLPQLTIDLLALLRSDSAYDRGQAGLLLALTVGDTINLSGDWNYWLAGVRIVTGIDEKITGSAWTLTLSVVPFSHLFGGLSPDVPALVWESARHEWDTEPRTWNL